MGGEERTVHAQTEVIFDEINNPVRMRGTVQDITERKKAEQALELRNDETIISSISVTDIFFDVYLGKWNYRAITKVKTWSYFLTIP